MNNILIKNKKTGFTLIEALVTITIIGTGIIGAMNLLSASFGSATVAKDKLIVADLAQEGFELFRNYRDMNYVKGNGWTCGLSQCLNAGGCMLSVDNTNPGGSVNVFSGDTTRTMCLIPGYSSGSGFAGYFYTSSGACPASSITTNFKRIITAQTVPANPNELKIINKMYWMERGRPINSGNSFEYVLYDWKPSALCNP